MPDLSQYSLPLVQAAALVLGGYIIYRSARLYYRRNTSRASFIVDLVIGAVLLATAAVMGAL